MKKKFTKAISAVAVAFMCVTHGIAQTSKNISFTAKLDGTQEVPANNTKALGVAHLTLTPKLDSLIIRLDYTGLQSAFSAAHIHLGWPGVSGGVVFTLPAPVNNIIKTVITGPTLTPAFIADLFLGKYYVNVHSVNLIDGEIRGQITPEADINFSCILNAIQETPTPTNPNVFGVASFKLAKHNGVLSYNVLVNNLSGPITNGHIHKGVPGVAGPVVQGLTMIGNNKFKGTLDPTSFLTALFKDSLYINVHTTANPDGEARGQLKWVRGLAASAVIDAQQEVPAPIVPTKAHGVGVFNLTTDLDSIFVAVALDSLTGKIQNAHLHGGFPGKAGSVILDLSKGINKDSNVVLFSGAVTASFVRSLVLDSVYFNVHTLNNTSGEVRGQLVPLARYTSPVCLSGSQEIPATNSTATGSGVVSIGRDLSNAHVMFVANGLSSAVTNIHIHQGLKGQTGTQLYTLTPSYVNNGAFLYLKNTDPVPFTEAAAIKGLKDSLYVNIYTTNFANGEIRGQIGKECESFITGITPVSSLENVTIYPNPTTSNLAIQLPATVSQNVTVTVYDAVGKLVLANDYTSSNLIDLNVSNLTKGIYMMRVVSGSEVYQGKFSKE
jgi:hypothetical protein